MALFFIVFVVAELILTIDIEHRYADRTGKRLLAIDTAPTVIEAEGSED